MEQIKKKHHYVWREYLRSWTEKDDLIHTYFKKENKVAKPNLINVAQERFYYSSEEFTLTEKNNLKNLTFQLSDNYSSSANLSILSAFTLYSDIKRKLNQNNIDFIEDELKFIKTNFIENLHSDIENYGKKLIEVKELEDLNFLKDQKELLKTMIFLCIQYTRTKNMKNSFSKTSFLDKYNNPISLIFGITLANKLTFEKNLRFKLLINKSNIYFITSDQPIINLIDKNKDGSVDDLIFYYPISPKISIQIDFKNNESMFESINIDESKVKYLNSKIYQYSNNLIFSNSEQQISKYKNCL